MSANLQFLAGLPDRTRKIVVNGLQFANGIFKFPEDTFLNDNPILGIGLAPLTFGTDFASNGVVTPPLAAVRSMYLTLRNKQNEAFVDNLELAWLLQRANADSTFLAFGRPQIVSLTTSQIALPVGQAALLPGTPTTFELNIWYMEAAEYKAYLAHQDILQAEWAARAVRANVPVPPKVNYAAGVRS